MSGFTDFLHTHSSRSVSRLISAAEIIQRSLAKIDPEKIIKDYMTKYIK